MNSESEPSPKKVPVTLRRSHRFLRSSQTNPSVLATRAFKRAFLSNLQRDPVELSIVSPFIGEIPGFKTVTEFARFYLSRTSVGVLKIITRPPNSRDPALLTSTDADAMDSMGVEVLIRSSPTLHSKMYLFRFKEGDTTSFVGSANFTLGGFERNEEAVACFRHPDDNREVSSLIATLERRGATTYRLWKARNRR